MTIIIKEMRVVATVQKTPHKNIGPVSQEEIRKLKREILEEMKRTDKIIHRKRYER